LGNIKITYHKINKNSQNNKTTYIEAVQIV